MSLWAHSANGRGTTTTTIINLQSAKPYGRALKRTVAARGDDKAWIARISTEKKRWKRRESVRTCFELERGHGDAEYDEKRERREVGVPITFNFAEKLLHMSTAGDLVEGCREEGHTS